MLRFSYILSVCLHLLGFGVVSLLVAQHADEPLHAEKAFPVELRKDVVQNTPQRTNQSPPLSPLKPETRPLAQTRENVPASPAFQRTAHTQGQPPPPPLVKPSRSIERVRPDMRSQPRLVPTAQEFERTARDFPTPVPAPEPPNEPTPVPTPLPTPAPTARPVRETSPTPAPPQPTAPPARFAQAEQEAGSLEGNAPPATHTPAEREKPVEEKLTKQQKQAQQAALQHYLEKISARIYATREYPRRARRKGWEGTVIVTVHILPTGEVSRLDLLERSEYKTLDKAALQAVKDAQPFHPFSEELTVERLTVNIPLQFTLR